MLWFRFAVSVIVVTVLQADLVGIIAVGNARPNLLIILLVFFAVYCKTTEAIISSFVIGFAADVIGSAMGPQMISFGLAGTLLAYLHRVIAVRKMPYQSATIFIVAFSTGMLAYYLNLLRGQAHIPEIHMAIFGTALYSAIVGPFLFLPCAWWMRVKTHRFSQH